MKQLKNVIWLISLLTIVLVAQLWSGTTGKIAGILTDKESGKPLPGANIVILGTMLGASSDLDGQYTILHVPPGTYSIQVTFIGYKKVTINDVRIEIDQTTRVDFALEEETIEMDEIVVVAERDILKPDVATSVVSVTNDEVNALPITNALSAIGLQAGIRGGWAGLLNGATQPEFVRNYQRGRVSTQSGITIRGGGADNILFMLDGVTLRDPRNNDTASKIALSSVEEISVERGGFNAEYGQVRSGVINVVSKEGGKKEYSGNIQVRVAPPAPKYWRGEGILDVHDPNSFALRPFFDDEVCWTGTGSGAWDEYTRRQYPEFMGWNEVSRILNSDNDPTNDLTPLGAQRVFMYEIRKSQPNDQADYDIDAGFGGPVPIISENLGNLRFFTSYRSTRDVLLFPLTRPDYKDWDFTLKINSDITPTLNLRISTLFGKEHTIRHNWDGTGTYFYPHYPTEIAGVASSITSPADLITLFSDFNFALSDIVQRSYAAKVTKTISPKTFYEVSLETFRRKYNTRPTALRDTSKLYEIVPGFYEDSNPFGYWPYDTKGVLITGGQHVAKPRDFTVVNSYTAKAEFTSQINFHNLIKSGITINYNDLNFDYGTIASATAGKTYATRVKMHVFPLRLAAFVQDKLETQGFTLNAGFRLDYSNSNSEWWVVDPFDRYFFSSQYEEEIVFPKAESKAQWQLSPRLGVAHPISENAKLFFNYGHFKQLPQYESLFRVQRTQQQAMSSFGNPDLTLAKTISYELGFDYLIADRYLLQVAGFYNDITDQQDFTQYISDRYGFSYTQSTSNNYQDIRGFELTLRKSSGQWFTGFANFTYQVNTTGHFGSSRSYDNPVFQKQWDDETVNLYQDRPIPQPYARINLNLFTPGNYGPHLWGHNILGSWLLNIVLDWQAGFWSTWNPKDLPSIAYNVKSVDYFGTDLRLEKIINLGQFRAQLFMDVHNVFNILRLWNTGDYDYMASLHLPESDAYDNIPGNDKVGDYRKPGVEFQPMEYQAVIDPDKPGKPRAIYYEGSTGKYYEYTNDEWSQVSTERIDKILDDKSYIDMPNASTFWFLDPRRIFFGIRLSFNFQ
jgi:outer membrane receptor protein involved in Fe transport